MLLLIIIDTYGSTEKKYFKKSFVNKNTKIRFSTLHPLDKLPLTIFLRERKTIKYFFKNTTDKGFKFK